MRMIRCSVTVMVLQKPKTVLRTKSEHNLANPKIGDKAETFVRPRALRQYGAAQSPVDARRQEREMAGSVNKVILIGNLGADPEIRRTQDGRPIANLRIATSESWRDKATGERKKKTEWHRVVIF